MQWSPQQDAALQAVSAWLRNPDGRPVFYLAGYAGTGKTTLARHLAADVEGLVLFAAYTGKAAHVLRQKGCFGATTLHSLIYMAKDKSRERLRQLEQRLVELLGQRPAEGEPPAALQAAIQLCEQAVSDERRNLAQPAFALNPESTVRDADLLVVDECSMVDARMGQDILSFGTPVLVLGDPAQLPPVGGGGYFTEREPDVCLTEIHRQARDNPIVALATDVREGRGLRAGTYGASAVINRHLLDPEQDVLSADQLLVGRNRTRRGCNTRVRQLRSLGTDWMPVPGDKLVCLRNDHDLGLLNGSLWGVTDMGGGEDDRLIMTVEPLDGVGDGPQVVEAWAHHFRGDAERLQFWQRKEAAEFDYGYALTVHKAQGSQWDRVVLFDETDMCRSTDDARRWLYTGITRAAEAVLVVRG